VASATPDGDLGDSDAETEPSHDLGLDLIQLKLRTVVDKIRQAFKDSRCICFSSDERDLDQLRRLLPDGLCTPRSSAEPSKRASRQAGGTRVQSRTLRCRPRLRRRTRGQRWRLRS
jgi:hypothetical protein